jgi:2'-5' RNA ligase
MAESALLVVVQEAEPLVGQHRLKHDSSAALGIPAHITLLYPFIAPEHIGDGERSDLRSMFLRLPAFDFRLEAIGRFPAVVYLAPEPAAPFVALTQAIWKLYPNVPPYRGEHGSTITPHLTVGQFDTDGEAAEFATRFGDEAQAQLPIASRATEVMLFDNSDGGYWRPRMRFELG